MIALLIVSHSTQLAEGVKEVAGQMTHNAVPIAAVGGTADGSLGTDPDRIRSAADVLAAMPDVKGILVLVDLGSAVMSAEVALEEFGHPYRLCDAPLVEGALVAAVEASAGSTLAEVDQAAMEAREFHKIQA